MKTEQSALDSWVAGLFVRDVLSGTIQTLYGRSRETSVLLAFLGGRAHSLSSIARQLNSGERAVRKGGWDMGRNRVGWLRAILEDYSSKRILIEDDNGNSITYRLNEANPVVILLREALAGTLSEGTSRH